MTKMEQVGDDLNYIRSVLDHSERSVSPPSIYFLWAVIGLVGFSLHDFATAMVPVYWSIAGPLGGLVSFGLGWRWSRRVGQGSAELGRYHALHWTGMMVAVFLLVPLPATGLMSGEGLARAILIVLALGYYTAGIYLVRSFLWIGLVMTAGYASLFFFDDYTWTAVGALFAVSLVWAGIRELIRGSSKS